MKGGVPLRYTNHSVHFRYIGLSKGGLNAKIGHFRHVTFPLLPSLTVHLHEGTRLSGRLAKQQWLAHDAGCNMQPFLRMQARLYASKSHMFFLSKR